jgi:hypothetical protein
MKPVDHGVSPEGAGSPRTGAGYTSTRRDLQRVATHILARARFNAVGRFGLRVTPNGIGTPLFGPDGEAIRIAGDTLIREFRQGGAARSTAIGLAGRSLGQLAEFAGLELTPTFSVGSDTPGLGDVGAPVTLDGEAAADVMAWLRVGSSALDRILVRARQPSVAQVWPEHFDIGIDVLTDHGRVNFGASPGDADIPDPYAYVSPWEESRPGDPTFWNASFGAVMMRGPGTTRADAVDDVVAFFGTGLRLLGG